MNNIFKKQAELQSGFVKAGMIDPSRIPKWKTVGEALDYIREMLYFMHEEVTELMNEIGGGRDAVKPWSSHYEESRKKQFVPTDHVKSEAIDMLCFAINICLAAGVSPDIIEEEYDKVHAKNKGRQNAHRNKENIPIRQV